MAKQLKDIYPVCGANLGGIGFIRIIPVDNVAGVSEPVNGIVSDTLQLYDETNYADVYFPVGEGSFDEQQAEDEHGIYYKATLKWFIPQHTPEMQEAIAALAGIRAIAIYQDNNGYARVVGSKDYPLRFSSDYGTGKKVRDANGIDMVLSGDSDFASDFYLHTQVIPAGTRKRFSAGFTFGFRRT
jgi:hypothetical protein